MNKNIKIVSLVVVASIVVLAFAGCSNTASKASKTNADKMKLSFAAWVTGPVKSNTLVEKKLEEIFPDIDFELLAFQRETWNDQLNTRVAGGDIPDIIYRDHNYYVIDYCKQNLLAEVPFDMVKENAPEIVAESLKYGSSVWLSCNVEGKNYGLPMMQPNQSRPSTDAWRMDWLRNVGISKVPETLAEYETALRKFVSEDPDKNGANDTYGLSYNGKSSPSRVFKTIFLAYGVTIGDWMLDGDKAVYGTVMPRMKDALIKLNSWYKDGLIDPEFITTDTAALKQKWVNGKIGFMPAGTWYRLIPGGENYEGLKAINPNAEITLGPAPKGPEGYFGYGSKADGDAAITSSIVFSKKLESDPQKLKRAIQVINKMMSDKELYGYLKFGQENVHWERDKNNGAVLKEPFNLPQNCGDVGINFFASFFATPSIQLDYARDDEAELYKYAIQGNVFPLDSWAGYFVPQEDAKVADSAQLIADKWIINFIIGKEPIDKFDQFVKEWYSAGGTKITNAYNEALKQGKHQVESITSNLK